MSISRHLEHAYAFKSTIYGLLWNNDTWLENVIPLWPYFNSVPVPGGTPYVIIYFTHYILTQQFCAWWSMQYNLELTKTTAQDAIKNELLKVAVFWMRIRFRIYGTGNSNVMGRSIPPWVLVERSTITLHKAVTAQYKLKALNEIQELHRSFNINWNKPTIGPIRGAS